MVDEVGVGPHPEPWPDDARLDPELLAGGDRRNVVDRYRYWSREAIVADLDSHRHGFHVAVENWEHDLNIGTVVRNANAFMAAGVHIVGRRRWNRRGAMVTDRYQHVAHHPDVADLVAWADTAGLDVVGVDGPAGAVRAGLRAGGSRALLRGPGGGDDGLLDRPVRVHPVDQRRGGIRHRDARLDPPARRPATFLRPRPPLPVSNICSILAYGRSPPVSSLPAR